MKAPLRMLVFLSLSPCSIPAQQHEWVVKHFTGQIVGASLVRLENDTLYVGTRGTTAPLHTSHIIEISGREAGSTNWTGVVVGGLLGGTLGYILGSAIDGNNDDIMRDPPHTMRLILGAASLGIGGAIGGSVSKSDEIVSYKLRDMSPTRRTALLEWLLTRENRPAVSVSRPDAIHMKNGTVVKGSLMALHPDSVVVIRPTGGSDTSYQLKDVELITRGPSRQSRSRPAEITYDPPPASMGAHLVLSVGGAFALGDFASTTGSSGGGAKTGFALGCEIHNRVNNTLGVLGGVQAMWNALEVPSGYNAEAGSWSSIWFLGGITIGGTIAPQNNFLLLLQGGLLIQGTPEIAIGSQTVGSETATAFGFGVGVGDLINDRVLISARYLFGEPSYSLPGPGSFSVNYDQPTSVFLMGIGIVF